MIEVTFYQDADGRAPVLDFFLEEPPRVWAKARVHIDLLADHGHRLRRPYADYLEDDIYELRFRVSHVNYRILYFFHGREAVVLANALTKEGIVPKSEIKRASERKRLFRANPIKHTHSDAMTRKHKKKPTTNALKIMDAIFGAKDPHWKEHIEEERQKLAIGMLIRETRESLKLTQVELAKRVGTTQSVISRIEDADYEGLKIATLQRIAMALKLPLAITLGARSIQLQRV